MNNTPSDYRNYLRVCLDCGEWYHDSTVHECQPPCNWDGDDDGVEDRGLFGVDLFWEDER